MPEIDQDPSDLEQEVLLLRARVAELEKREQGQEFHQLLAEHTTDQLNVTTLDGRVLFASQRVEEILGYPIAERLGRRVFEVVHPDDRKRVIDALLELRERGRETAETFRAIRADGEIVWLETTGKVVRTPGGDDRVVLISRDVTERRRVEQELIESKNLFEDFARHSHDVFGILSPEGDRILYLSPAVEELVGISPEQLCAGEVATLLENIHPDDRALIASVFAERKPECDIEFRLQARNGDTRWLWACSRAVRAPDGRLRRIVFTARDVTARKQAEAAVEQSRADYHLLSELAADFNFSVLFGSPKQIEIEWISSALERISGYKREDVSPELWVEVVPEEDRRRLFDWGWRTLAGELSEPVDYRIIRSDGKVRWLRTHMRMQQLEGGVRRCLGSTTDITEMKRLEEDRRRHSVRLEVEVAERTRQLERANKTLRALQERLIHAERMRTAEDLSAAIAHSINNPLAALMGTIEMMREADLDTAMLDRSIELCHRIRVVVERTLQLFRKGTLNLGLHDPADVADEMFRELEARALDSDVKLEVAVDRDLPEIEADRPLLVAALVSVAENALDAMPDGGKLLLEVSWIASVDVMRFRLSDTGHGIPPELREKVLRPFFTTKGGGTGLGLAIAQGVVQGHYGRIAIEQRSGGGTLVVIEVPVRREASTES